MKIKPDVFLQAAESIEHEIHDYACCAILEHGTSAEEVFFTDLFQIDPVDTFGILYSQTFNNWASWEELKEIRLLALCFTYEIATCKKQKKGYRK